MLDGLEKRETGAFAFDFQVDEDVFRAAMGEEFLEGLRIHLEVDVLGAFSVNDGWELAFATHLLESSGSAARAGSCFE